MSERVKWALRVPHDPSQSIYVWLDALTNYLTVAGNTAPICNLVHKDIPKDLFLVCGHQTIKYLERT
jgi:methionyl-tRNA synthetase